MIKFFSTFIKRTLGTYRNHKAMKAQEKHETAMRNRAFLWALAQRVKLEKKYPGTLAYWANLSDREISRIAQAALATLNEKKSD